MDLKRISDNGLKMLHDALRGAFEEDEGLPSHAKKYGVREFADWRAWSDTLEIELTNRKLPFSPVPWNTPALPKAPARVFYYGVPGEVYVVQHFYSGPFYVEQIPVTGGPATQLAGPFDDAGLARVEASKH